MIVTLTSISDTACELKEVTCATSAVFPLPIGKLPLVAALRTFLSDAESRDAGAGPVHFERRRDGVAICYGSGVFLVRYANLLPLVLEE
jgi:hypothetical protein